MRIWDRTHSFRRDRAGDPKIKHNPGSTVPHHNCGTRSKQCLQAWNPDRDFSAVASIRAVGTLICFSHVFCCDAGSGLQPFVVEIRRTTRERANLSADEHQWKPKENSSSPVSPGHPAHPVFCCRSAFRLRYELKFSGSFVESWSHRSSL